MSKFIKIRSFVISRSSLISETWVLWGSWYIEKFVYLEVCYAGRFCSLLSVWQEVEAQLNGRQIFVLLRLHSKWFCPPEKLGIFIAFCVCSHGSCISLMVRVRLGLKRTFVGECLDVWAALASLCHIRLVDSQFCWSREQGFGWWSVLLRSRTRLW